MSPVFIESEFRFEQRSGAYAAQSKQTAQARATVRAFARAIEEGSGALPRCEVGWALVRITLKRLKEERVALLSRDRGEMTGVIFSFLCRVYCKSGE